MGKKRINNLKKATAITANIVLVLQIAFIGVVMTPQGAFAADYEAPADTEGGESNHTGSFHCIDEHFNDDGCGMHVDEDETLHVDTFDFSSIDDNTIENAKLKIRYMTGPGYNGDGDLEYALEGDSFSSALTPTLSGIYVIEEFDLLDAGINTKEDLADLDVRFTNNSTEVIALPVEDNKIGVKSVEIDCDVVIDYLWIDVSTKESPTIEFTETPDLLTNEDTATFAWQGVDDVTPSEALDYSYRVDDGTWTDYVPVVTSGNIGVSQAPIGPPIISDGSVTIEDLEDGEHTFDLRATDGAVGDPSVAPSASFLLPTSDPNRTLISYSWTVDTIAPELTVEATPALANQNSDTVAIEVVPNEELAEQISPVVVTNDPLPVKVLVLGPTYGVKLIVNEVDGSPLTVYIPKDVNGDYKYNHTLASSGEKTVMLTASGKDLAGNEGNGEGGFTLDNIAPSAVTDLVATGGNAQVDLTWTNPTDADFAGVRIFRNGVEITAAVTNAIALTDTNVVNGTTYTYDVYAYDTSGNRGVKVSASATPVAPLVASTVVQPFIPQPTGEEIKAASDENGGNGEDGEGDEKDTEIKDEKKLPTWGIIFLLILAGIGGYLFYAQRPATDKK